MASGAQVTRARTPLGRSRELAYWRAHLGLMQVELMRELAYGYEAHGRDDKMVDAAREMNTIGTSSAAPGQLLINKLLSLAYVPGWLPRISYKPLARQSEKMWHEVIHTPLQHGDRNSEPAARPRGPSGDGKPRWGRKRHGRESHRRIPRLSVRLWR
ncbi:hypothetical protein BC834DRAFT_181154 [Gloeopeniophorella convolvens]|nr:hypothetical protein BC834DRAFT_181154 [Gloeopeniophorella convolvens]